MTDKIYTTVYDTFRGVDFTNDPSNVWRHRSPSGVNMLPDASGRPFKRFGWDVDVSADKFLEKYAEDHEGFSPEELTINKLYYFTLHGKDHIFVFTNIGVFIYRIAMTIDEDTGEAVPEKELATSLTYSYDPDVIDSYNRAYYFEGNGEAAFYIYGNFRMWRYRFNNDAFVFENIEPYVPTVNISVDARHESGVSYESVNLLSGYIAESYVSNRYRDATATTTSSTITSVTIIDRELLINSLVEDATYEFIYNSGKWTLSGVEASMKDYGINVHGVPEDEDTIEVVISSTNKIILAESFDSADGLSVIAYPDTPSAFGIEIITSGDPTSHEAKLLNNTLTFYDSISPLVDGEDSLKVIYPRPSVSKTTRNASAVINVEAGD